MRYGEPSRLYRAGTRRKTNMHQPDCKFRASIVPSVSGESLPRIAPVYAFTTEYAARKAPRRTAKTMVGMKMTSSIFGIFCL